MDVQVEDLSSVSKKLSFTIPAETVDEEITSAFRTLRKEVMLPGFRPGKVPRKLLEQRFGKEIRAEVSGKLIGDAFDKAIEEKGITPVGPPDIDQADLVGGQPFTFSVTMEVKPEVKIEGYEGLKVVWDKPTVEDAEVDEQIEGMRHQAGSLGTVEEARPAADGDVVEATFTLSHEGQDDLVREHLLISVPEDSYHGFLVDMVKGKAKDETGEGEVAVPGDYIEGEWAGKTVQAKVEVHEIKAVQYPDLNDDFAKDMGHDTVDAMTAAIRFRIQEAKDKRARDDASRKIVRKIIAANEFEVPRSMVENRAQSLVSSIASQMMPGMDQSFSFKLDDLDDDKKAGVLEEAEFIVRREAVLEAVVTQQELAVSDEEIEAKIQSMAEETGQRAETIKGYLMKSDGLEGLKDSMLQDKALDLILEKAEIVDEDPDEIPETPPARVEAVAEATEAEAGAETEADSEAGAESDSGDDDSVSSDDDSVSSDDDSESGDGEDD